MRARMFRIAILVAAVAGPCGCAPMSMMGNTKMVQEKLKLVSAGYTGCMPAENTLSNIADAYGGATWNATCKGRTYLCTTVATGDSDSFHCAPVAE
jgi:hypothetical protein